jgi:ferric-dicitrate binding protein FerR (iron transport regulator)
MDAYAIVGVHPSASDTEIREAYLRRSKELHPDRFADATGDERAAATRAMQQLNAAYDELRHRAVAPTPSPATAPAAPWQPAPRPVAPPRRARWLLIAVAAVLVTSVLVVLTGDARNAPPAPSNTGTTVDLTQLDGECLTLDTTGELEDIVDCTRPHDARVVKVVDHGTECPVYAHARMAGPTKDLCLDTHQ